MTKSTPPDNSASTIADQVQKIDKAISTCKKFIEITSYSSITIIFSGKHKGHETTDLIKIDQPDFAIVPVKELFDFFSSYAENLERKKTLLLDGFTNRMTLTILEAMFRRSKNHYKKKLNNGNP